MVLVPEGQTMSLPSPSAPGMNAIEWEMLEMRNRGTRRNKKRNTLKVKATSTLLYTVPLVPLSKNNTYYTRDCRGHHSLGQAVILFVTYILSIAPVIEERRNRSL
jgi:hypothetical protein